MFPEAKNFQFQQTEEQILEKWAAEKTFEASIENRKDAPNFTFYEGPPTANGHPGIHHVMARTIKDSFCRYKTMKGFRVERKGGWDTHGLPVEIEVEKRLGLEGRHKVIEYGIEKYNQACKESVLQYKDLWDKLTIRMGYWVDLDSPYVTYHTQYIESVWWLLKQMHEKGLLYKGHKITWYSPNSGTVLSSHEVSLGYKEIQDPSVTIRFQSKDEENTYFLAWTTTPWTLPSNMALAVGPKIDYVKVKTENDAGETEFLVLAEALLSVLKKETVEIIARYKGTDLVGRTYVPLFPYFAQELGESAGWRIIAADYVSTSDGTGIVHIAPAFGADDYVNAQQQGIPMVNPILPDGTFSEQVPLVAELYFKDANKVITKDLKERGLLFRHETYLHNYPHDWRKGTPLMQYPTESWFIRTTALKDRLVALNNTINWQPEAIGTGRFGQWLENNVDWALSRNRFWGTPLPVWVSDKNPNYVEVIGSVAELRAKCEQTLPENDADVDLHRPYVDDLTWKCPEGGTMRRVTDLIDVWFDSGAMPFAQWHYPFENKEKFEANYPADFIAEGVDQTRGWFYTLHAISTLVMDSVAYKNVISNGLLLDEKGEKMSKTKGNVINPFTCIDEHGVDPVRWYMMSNTPPWEDLKFSFPTLEITKRKFFGTITNTYQFFATYANIDTYTYEGKIALTDRTELDRWIISRLNSTIATADEAYAAYHPTRAARAVEQFVEELSNWYVRRSRRRFWKSGQDVDKLGAYETLVECLDGIARLMAPIAPFYSEWLYGNLWNGTSVHLADFPQSQQTALDTDLEHRMGLAREISSVVLGIRNEVQINVRQPLGKMLVVTNQHVDEASVNRVTDIILDEVNVKELAFLGIGNKIVDKSVKPNFKVLGKKVGALMKATAAAIAQLSPEQIDQFEQNGALSIQVAEQSITLLPEDLEIISKGVEGWNVGQEGGVTVALDVRITEALKSEGMAREFINRIQNFRKSCNLAVSDRIELQYQASDALVQLLTPHHAWIQRETLSTALSTRTPDMPFVDEVEMDDEKVQIGIRKSST